MIATKTNYEDMPETIMVPHDFIHKKCEVIFMVEETASKKQKISDYFGLIPDFPERPPQGEYESRDAL